MRRNGKLLRGSCLILLLVVTACSDEEYESPGTVITTPRAIAAGEGAPPRQILFGDLHVHTTYSMDAFEQSLPDLAIIDVGLEDEFEGGFELCRELRTRAPGVNTPFAGLPRSSRLTRFSLRPSILCFLSL